MHNTIKDILKKVTTPDQRNSIRRAWRRILLHLSPGSLSKFGRIYGTDKADEEHSFKGQSYLDIYEGYFRHLRKKPVNLLEIGVLRGTSLKMWKRYFSRGSIFGLDINPDTKKHEKPGISIEIGDQANETVLKNVSDKAGKFDIVIDDGSHQIDDIIKSFKYLFPRLNKGGIYVIEDLGCSYEDIARKIEELCPGTKFNNERVIIDEFFRKIVHKMDHQEGDIVAIHFWSYLAIIIKAEHK